MPGSIFINYVNKLLTCSFVRKTKALKKKTAKDWLMTNLVPRVFPLENKVDPIIL